MVPSRPGGCASSAHSLFPGSERTGEGQAARRATPVDRGAGSVRPRPVLEGARPLQSRRRTARAGHAEDRRHPLLGHPVIHLSRGGDVPERGHGVRQPLPRALEPIIHEHGGFIDNYEGDSILALFDAGTDAGVRAAIAMAHAERSNNQRRNEAGLPPIQTGFGLNSAGVMMGIVGGVSALRATIMGMPSTWLPGWRLSPSAITRQC